MPTGVYKRTEEYKLLMSFLGKGGKLEYLEKTCLTCGKIFYVSKHNSKAIKAKYCSLVCRVPWNKNLTKETDIRVVENAKKISVVNSDGRCCGHFGSENGMFGAKHSKEAKEKMSIACINRKPTYTDTKIEIALQNILLKNNIKFETQKGVIGRPDIFIEPNICIFCDGDYYHANPNKYIAEDTIMKGLFAQQIWGKDEWVTQKLEGMGYIVLRFWENEINSNIDGCFCKITKVINGKA